MNKKTIKNTQEVEAKVAVEIEAVDIANTANITAKPTKKIPKVSVKQPQRNNDDMTQEEKPTKVIKPEKLEKATKPAKLTKAVKTTKVDKKSLENIAPEDVVEVENTDALDVPATKPVKTTKTAKTTKNVIKTTKVEEVAEVKNIEKSEKVEKLEEAIFQDAQPSLNSSNLINTSGELSEKELLAMTEDDYMNSQQLKFFKLRLQKIKHDILENADQTTENLRETVFVPDPVDRASIEEEHALELRTRDRERKLLAKIEQALRNIETQNYGWCEETGEPIGLLRLLARPTATLCLEAQERRELRQKMFNDD